MNRNPAIVWDMGGIMYRYFTEMLVDRGREQGWPLPEMALGPTGPGPDAAYEDLLEGRIGETAYVQGIIDSLAGRGIQFDPASDLAWTTHRRPQTWDAITRIAAAGHLQAVLTNDASRWLGDGWWENWEHAGHFAAVIDVITLTERKPDPGPYLAAARALRIAPQGCLFIDDLPVNCRGAEAVGMASLRFDVADPDGSIERLLDRLEIG